MHISDLMGFCSAHKRIFCYGAGKYGTTIRAFLSEQGAPVEAFIVTRKNSRKSLMGISIYTLDEVAGIGDDDTGIIVGVGAGARDEIEKTLATHELNNYFLFDEELFREVEENTQYRLDFHSDNNICVLLYHRVSKLPIDIWQLAIAPEIFEMHIRFFKENYNILRFEDNWTNVDTPSLVITFDDGYADNYLYALPILEKYQVPATIFVSTGNLGTNQEFWWDELERIVCLNHSTQYVTFCGNKFSLSTFDEKKEACRQIRLQLKQMLPDVRNQCLRELMNNLGSDPMPRPENRSLTIKELRQLAKSPYITIGGHTITHNMLSAEPEDMQMQEIVGSKLALEELLETPVTTFSYPFGSERDYTEITAKIVKNAGFQKAATTSVGLANGREDSMLIPRNGMPFFTKEKDVGRYLRKLFCM